MSIDDWLAEIEYAVTCVLDALSDCITSKGYLDFTTGSKALMRKREGPYPAVGLGDLRGVCVANFTPQVWPKADEHP